MTIDSASDILSVFISLAFGAFISLIYSFFKAFRLSFKTSNIAVIIEDIIFAIISSVLTFLLLFICVKGEIRWFILIFEFIGFILFKRFLSKYIVKLIVKINLFIKKAVLFNIKTLLLFTENKINSFFDKIFYKNSKKSLKHKQ